MLAAMLQGWGFNGFALVAFLADVAADPEKLARVDGITADAEALQQMARMVAELVLPVATSPKPTHDGSAAKN